MKGEKIKWNLMQHERKLILFYLTCEHCSLRRLLMVKWKNTLSYFMNGKDGSKLIKVPREKKTSTLNCSTKTWSSFISHPQLASSKTGDNWDRGLVNIDFSTFHPYHIVFKFKNVINSKKNMYYLRLLRFYVRNVVYLKNISSIVNYVFEWETPLKRAIKSCN